MPIYVFPVTGGGGAAVDGAGIYSEGFSRNNVPINLEGAPYENDTTFPSPNRRYTMPKAGTLKDFKVTIVTNSLAGPANLRVFVDGVATPLDILVNPGVTGLLSSGVTLAVTRGQEISFNIDMSGTVSGQLTGELAVRLE